MTQGNPTPNLLGTIGHFEALNEAFGASAAASAAASLKSSRTPSLALSAGGGGTNSPTNRSKQTRSDWTDPQFGAGSQVGSQVGSPNLVRQDSGSPGEYPTVQFGINGMGSGVDTNGNGSATNGNGGAPSFAGSKIQPAGADVSTAGGRVTSTTTGGAAGSDSNTGTSTSGPSTDARPSTWTLANLHLPNLPSNVNAPPPPGNSSLPMEVVTKLVSGFFSSEFLDFFFKEFETSRRLRISR
jgi:hypothetical protein